MAYNKFYLACKWQKKPIAYHAFCNLKLSRSRGMIHDRKVSFSEISFQFTLSLSIFSMKVEVIFHQTNCFYGAVFLQPQKRIIKSVVVLQRQILCQKVCQRISVMKTNNGVFKTKHESKCQFSGNTSPLLRFYDKLYDVIFDDLFLTL